MKEAIAFIKGLNFLMAMTKSQVRLSASTVGSDIANTIPMVNN
jgi:hypothetical protein